MTTAKALEPLKSIHDLTNDWLATALNIPSLKTFSAKRIGTGQVSFCYRVTLDYDAEPGPASVVVKLVSDDPASRGAGLSLGIYERETKFYNEVAPLVRSHAIARCYYSSFRDGNFTIVLEDHRNAAVGDELVGATIDQARLAVAEMASIHTQLSSYDLREAKAPWLNVAKPFSREILVQLHKKFLATFGERISQTQREICDRLLLAWENYQAGQGLLPSGFLHGDFRLDNLLFGPNSALTIVDWQTIATGPFMTDMAYFLGCSLNIEDRRAHQVELISIYHNSLGENSPVTLEDCYRGIRHQSFFGVFMAIVSSMLVERTPRGDEMFLTMFDRHCAQVLDLDAMAVITPDDGPVDRSAWIEPEFEDEGTHQPGIEYLWNESWYFDLVDAEQEVACYVRMGMNPNQNGTWYMAVICGPNIPTTAVLDFAAPLPDSDLVLRTDKLHATQKVILPLVEYNVTLDAIGKQHSGTSLISLDNVGAQETAVKLDLTWKTVCKPYKWRLTTRYEISCKVSGAVRVGDQNWSIKDSPGQRDHSWGVRDWWGLDWMWSALHLSDGTHIHGVDLRFEHVEAIKLGYVQKEYPQSSHEILNVVTPQKMTAQNGLLDSSQIMVRSAEDKMTIEAKPIAHGALKLVSSDGRVSKFARAWVNLTLSDGRTGVGWIEFNDAFSERRAKD